MEHSLPEREHMHHAYTVAGGHALIPRILAELEGVGIVTAKNPDIYIREYELFSVEDARTLLSRAQSRPMGTGPNVFLISFTSATRETQNALLKTLEEPPSDSVFFLITPHPDTLLETVRSRVQELVLEDRTSAQAGAARAFLEAHPAERLEQVAGYVGDKKDPAVLADFLHSLEHQLSVRGVREPEVRRALHALYSVNRYSQDSGAMTKMLLESLALALPVPVRA